MCPVANAPLKCLHVYLRAIDSYVVVFTERNYIQTNCACSLFNLGVKILLSYQNATRQLNFTKLPNLHRALGLGFQVWSISLYVTSG